MRGALNRASRVRAKFLIFSLFLLSSFSIQRAEAFFFSKKEILYELRGMPKNKRQPPSFNWCWASVIQMAKEYKTKQPASLCKIVSNHLNDSCCVGDLQRCNRKAWPDEAAAANGMRARNEGPILERADYFLSRGIPVALLLDGGGPDKLHVAMLQAKYAHSKGYRIYDPYHGIIDVSEGSMKKRVLYKGFVWSASYIFD